jgi:hypothetical protein
VLPLLPACLFAPKLTTSFSFSFFHSRTVHRDISKVLLPTDAQNNCFKRILKFTLKQRQHVSVLSPSSGSIQFELAKVTFFKTNSSLIYIGVVNLVVWLLMQPHHQINRTNVN